MANTLQGRHRKIKFNQMDISEELALISEKAKQELFKLSPQFSHNQTTSPSLRKRVQLQQISAWAESQLPFIPSTQRKPGSVIKRSSEKGRSSSHQVKRSKTSCFTQCGIDTSQTYKKRQFTMSRISLYNSDVDCQSFRSQTKNNIGSVPSKSNIKHPFKSNIFLKLKKKRKLTFSNVSVVQNQRKTSQKIESQKLFQDNNSGRNLRLLNFIQSINSLKLRQKNEFRVQRSNLI